MPVPPKSVQQAAALGLRLRREHGRGGTEVGVARARDLSNGVNVSDETVTRMRSYFSRHAVDKEADSYSEDPDDPSAGYVAWLLWGGDAGREWAESLREDNDASTPAAPSERRKGSRRNPAGSASGSRGGIEIDDATEQALRTKLDEHNEKHSAASKRTDLGVLKAVYRRGAGAFSTSHRPGMTRGQWAMARVNAFLELLRTGKPGSAKYITDNDLLPAEHARSTREDGVRYLELAARFDQQAPELPAGLRELLAPPQRLPNGRVIIEGVGAMPAVKTYGGRREYTPYAVLAAAADRYDGLSVDDEHATGIASPSNPGVEHGVILSAERLDDCQAIKLRMRFDRMPVKRGLSVGYHPVRIDATPGETEQGERYDARWLDATPNHVAQTNNPRVAGAAMRLDAFINPKSGGSAMAQITIDGVSAEVSDAFAQAWRSDKQAAADRLDSTTKERDALQGEVKALQAQADARNDAEAILAEARKLAKLWAQAAPRLDKETADRLDAMDEGEIMRAVVERAFPGMDFSDDELHGAYKVALGKQAEDMKPEAAADIDDMPERKDSRTGGTLDAKWLKQNF